VTGKGRKRASILPEDSRGLHYKLRDIAAGSSVYAIWREWFDKIVPLNDEFAWSWRLKGWATRYRMRKTIVDELKEMKKLEPLKSDEQICRDMEV
jgi:hypothetical protein